MTGHIFIYGGIGTGAGEVSINNVKSQIDPNASEYVVHVMSPGGDVFEGYGIYNILKNTGKKITAHVEGLCASIATLIVGSADEIIMNRTSEFMIHNPQINDLKGDANKLRNVADQLDKIKNLLIDVYERRTGLPKEKLWELYDNETWLTAQEAQKMGFVDDVQDAIKAVAKLDLNNIKMEKPTFWAKVKRIAGFTNNYEETLQDGTKIMVISEDEDWTGKQVITEDGNALADGDHVLASGKTITVSGGVISAVKDADAANNAEPNDEMENKIKELEAQLAEAKTAQAAAKAEAETAKAEAATAQASISKYTNRLEALEKKYLNLQEKSLETIGDKSDVSKGDGKLKTGETNDHYDPMAEMFRTTLKARNLI
jgi:ATP-dependent protease ClpP protease subunit